MELKIKEITFPEVIEFNFDELKQEISNRVDMYRNMVYSEDQVKQAKEDRANLNKFLKALSDERIKVKKQCLQPYEAFEAKVAELSKIVQEPIALIDEQVKGFEEKQKQEKLQKINEYWDSIDTPEGLEFAKIYDSKWLNASVSMKAVQGAIDDAVLKFNAEMDTLANLPEYGFEAQQTYISTLDITKALNEAHRLAEMARKKAEAEAKKAEFVPVENTMPFPEVEQQTEETCNEDSEPSENFIPTFAKPEWCVLKVNVTESEKETLKQYLEVNNIEFKFL